MAAEQTLLERRPRLLPQRETVHLINSLQHINQHSDKEQHRHIAQQPRPLRDHQLTFREITRATPEIHEDGQSKVPEEQEQYHRVHGGESSRKKDRHRTGLFGLSRVFLCAESWQNQLHPGFWTERVHHEVNSL